jgi:SulP family sulfate permease
VSGADDDLKASRLGARLRALLPSRADYAPARTSWRQDLIAGVTVGVVALPLALAFGISSGFGARAGLVTAIIAGVVAAVFGGSQVQVSGPTGAMTVVLVPIVARYGVQGVLVVGVLAGIVMVVAALFGLGKYLVFVPWPVVEGFTVGIATIIVLQQVPNALGVSKPKGENAAAVAWRSVDAAFHGAANLDAILIVILVAAVMLVLPRVRRGIPASLVAVVVATAVVETLGWDVTRIGSLPHSLPLPSVPHWSSIPASELFGPVFAVAVLAALESLLSAKVADGLADVERHDPNRELFGQALANIASPFFGGMPATGAIARTAVNARAGARSRLAAIMHAVVLTVVVFAGSGLVAKIPLAALASVLMVTALRMVDRHAVRSVLRTTRSDALVFVVTAVVTIAFDLILAVEIGMAVAAVLTLRQFARASGPIREDITSVDATTNAALRHEHIVTYRLDGALFFGAVQQFFNTLLAVDDVRVVILRLPELQVLDATGAHALGEIIDELESRGVTVLVKGPRPRHRDLLREVGALDRLAHENHLFTDLDAAVAHAHMHARRHAPTG